MGKRIAMVGTGALGGYVGGYLAHNGQDVTLIDMWPENIEAIRARGLELDGVTPEEKFTVTRAKSVHFKDLSSLAGQPPFDIAFISVKSYDTERVTKAILPYLAPGGFAVSLQNCINEETIAAIVGPGRTLGVIASIISVELYEAGRIRRMAAKGGAKHTVFRIGEMDGRTSERAQELASFFSLIDSSKVTPNLGGERWSKLIQNGMRNGVSAASGLTGSGCDRDDALRRFAIRLGGEGIRVAQALGYKLEKLGELAPARLEQASAGDAGALAEIEAIMVARTASNPRAGIQRPSMAQDITKGRRTEIEFMNGYIVAKGRQAGIPTPANEKLVNVVLRVERGELKPSPANLGGPL
jgi:2-dehydropantoate 2-reductase